MSKVSGLGMGIVIDGYSIPGDVQSFNVRGGPAVFETTGIDKYAFERIGLRRDGSMDLTTYFNPDSVAGGQATDQMHVVMRALPLSDRMITAFHPIGEAWVLVCKQGNYDPTVQADGGITCAVNAQGNAYGLEVAKVLTGGVLTQGAAGNVASVDFGAGANFGLQAHLQVIAVTGTSVTVKLQESSDNGVGDAWADVVGGGFTAATGRGTQRIQTARNQAVDRYLRVVTSGVFTSATFLVTAEVNLATVNF